MAPSEYPALSKINLTVEKGRRLGVIGRNGAGKTTLLKLLCGHVAATSGTLEVNGTVHALMTTGLGFNPEQTGAQNIASSLLYNGLSKGERVSAAEDIEDFCELGDFINQPVKTYSSGMQSRLAFACATAIKPEILIIDEILGAGDAYFIAKSKQRVERLVGGGCTMLLVSHSMGQVLEMCDEAIWISDGKIRKRGPSLEVVKAYEEDLNSPIAAISESSNEHSTTPGSQLRGFENAKAALAEVPLEWTLQDPEIPQPSLVHDLRNLPERLGFSFESTAGLSRWGSAHEIEITGFSIFSAEGRTNKLQFLRPAMFVAEVVSKVVVKEPVRAAFTIYDLEGRVIVRGRSGALVLTPEQGARTHLVCSFDPMQLGPGDYILSVCVLDYGSLLDINNAKRYDLLSRSFEFTVELPAELETSECRYLHQTSWCASQPRSS